MSGPDTFSELASQYKDFLYQNKYIHDSANQPVDGSIFDKLPNISFGPRNINYPNYELENKFKNLPNNQ